MRGEEGTEWIVQFGFIEMTSCERWPSTLDGAVYCAEYDGSCGRRTSGLRRRVDGRHFSYWRARVVDTNRDQ